jgi:hypothetical protein
MNRNIHTLNQLLRYTDIKLLGGMTCLAYNVPRLCDERNRLTQSFRVNECNKLVRWFKVAQYPLIAKPLLCDSLLLKSSRDQHIQSKQANQVFYFSQNLNSRLTSKFVWLSILIFKFLIWFVFQQVFILIFCQTN